MSTRKKDPKPADPLEDLAVDSDLPPDADLEERFNDFWKKNGPGIFGGIAIGAVVVVGIQLFQYMGEQKEASIREAFAAADTLEAKVSFAEAHPDHELAGLAHLQVADVRYDEGRFAEAAESYAASARSFTDPTLVSRALLGQGMSLLRTGQGESGRALLEAVAMDATALDQTRGEAAYHLAVSYWEMGQIEQAIDATGMIQGLDAPFWSYRGELLGERLAHIGGVSSSSGE